LNDKDPGITLILLFVKLCADEQTQNGEHPSQSFFGSLLEDCSVYIASSHLSKTEQGTTMLNNK
jgi:hypothetical protein